MSATKPSRRRLLTGVVVLVLVLAVAVTFVRTEQTLHRQRATLLHSEQDIASTRRSIDAVQRDRRQIRSRALITHRQFTTATNERRFFVASYQHAKTSTADVMRQLGDAQAALIGVASNTNTVTHCLSGISTASGADRNGNTAGAVSALNDSSADCAKTFALSTGALSPYDFPDPSAMYTNGAYYAYSTNSGAGDIQVMRSTDLASWQFVGNGLAAIPSWATRNSTWAPSVLARGGRYIAYYTIPDAHRGRRCVSRAIATSPAGPFVDDTAGPLVCDIPMAGAIDPSPYVDATGHPYLLWKAETNPPVIWSEPLSDDGLSVVGNPTPLIAADQAFERGTVEAPSMVGVNGTYYLFYSAGDWQTSGYTTAYATCATPSGPCVKPPNNRVLVSGSRMIGTGGAEAFQGAGGRLYVAFAAYAPSAVGYPNNRYFHVAPLGFSNGRPVVAVNT